MHKPVILKKLPALFFIVFLWTALQLHGKQLSSGNLNEIIRSGTLKVGTCGDYPPVTIFDPGTGDYSGTDIDMIRNFAKYLGVRPVFVKTTWTNLSKDLKEGRFDIAAGGISATQARAADFLLSDHIETTGKIPLIRYKDKDKYKNIRDIDKQGVTVIANEGGTNYSFAKTSIKNARLITVKDNLSVFGHLIRGDADAFFTDKIEALYRSSLHPELYAVDPEHPLTNEYKVVMVQKNSRDLIDKFNQFLEESYKGKKQ